MGRNLNDFYQKLANPGTSEPSPFELASPYRFNVDLSITKPSPQECKIKNHAQFSGDLLSLAVQEIEIPNITAGESMEQQTSFTGFMSLVDNSRTYTDSNEIEITFLNSIFAPHENFFFNWMRETRSHEWVYDNYPFSKGNIDVMAYSNSDEDFNLDLDFDTGELILGDYGASPVVKYKFVDVFPIEIETMSFKQEYATNETRSVKFRFNYMTVNDQDLAGPPLQRDPAQEKDLPQGSPVITVQ